MNRWTVAALAVAGLVIAVLAGLVMRMFPADTSTEPPPVPPPVTTTSPSPSAPLSPTAAPSPTGVEPTGEGGDPEPGATADPGDASPGATPYSATEEARIRWEPVVVGFAENFTRTEGSDAATWRTGLKPFTTAAVQKQLATVDLENVPAGTYESYEVVEHGETQLAARVTYQEGFSLVLYVISEGDDWRVFQYDRYEE